MVLEAVDGIRKQWDKNFSFWISDNSTDPSVPLTLASIHPDIRLVVRGGGLNQFEHMISIIRESASESILLTHDDDVLAPNFVSVFSSLKQSAGKFTLLLNRVIALKDEAPAAAIQKIRWKPYGEEINFSSNRILKDYLRGNHTDRFYSISMTVLNGSSAKNLCHVLESNGLYADACFIVAMANMGSFSVNNQPVGLIRLTEDSLSWSSSIRDMKLFVRYMRLQDIFLVERLDLKFYKLRLRFFKKNIYKKFKSRKVLYLSILCFLFRVPYNFLILSAAYRSGVRQIKRLIRCIRVFPN